MLDEGYSKVIQLYIYIYTHTHIYIYICIYIYIYNLLQILFCSGYYKIMSIVPCAIQRSRLITYFTYNGVYMSKVIQTLN